MNVIDVVQGSEEWQALRVGKVTGSRVADIMAKTKTGYRASRLNYLAELVAERLTGRPAVSFTTQAMIWGTEQEPAARLEYSFSRDLLIEPAGFVLHPRIANFGSSPDGFVLDPRQEQGLVEIKCPLTATHLNTLQTEKVPTDYFIQMQSNLACTGLQWCDYVSFDPRLPEPMQLFVRRIERDDETIELIETEVELFLDELRLALDDLKRRYPVEEVVL